MRPALRNRLLATSQAGGRISSHHCVTTVHHIFGRVVYRNRIQTGKTVDSKINATHRCGTLQDDVKIDCKSNFVNFCHFQAKSSNDCRRVHQCDLITAFYQGFPTKRRDLHGKSIVITYISYTWTPEERPLLFRYPPFLPFPSIAPLPAPRMSISRAKPLAIRSGDGPLQALTPYGPTA